MVAEKVMGRRGHRDLCSFILVHSPNLCSALSISPQYAIVDFQFPLRRGNVFTETMRIFGVAGGGTKVWNVRSPEFVECPHRKFAEVFGRHRCQGSRQEAFALHAKADMGSRFWRAPFVAAFGVAFVDRLDPVLGKMVLQKCSVKIAATVFVADDVC